MAFDFKKEYRSLYQPGEAPEIVSVPAARYVGVRGTGDPNEEGGAYKRAVGICYAVAYTLRMSGKGARRIDGFFEFVVPPLEGFWWQEGVDGANYADKRSFEWICVLRLPDFVREADFAWAVQEASRKKKLDCSPAALLALEEGLCVQALHRGPFDREPETVAAMDAFLLENGYQNDFSRDRMHHEIYLSDPRRVPPERWRTVIRHPVRRDPQR